MIDTSRSIIHAVSVHLIGNGDNHQALTLSDSPLSIEDELLKKLLVTYFLSNFSTPAYYSFTSSGDDFKLNPVFQFVTEIFADDSMHHQHSINIAKHLHAATQHPNIKPGDLYVALFSGVTLEGRTQNAVGIFKSENKENYIKLQGKSNPFHLSAEEGINIRKLDKACLILDVDKEAGYRILIHDNTNKSDAQFWTQDFLNIGPWSDSYHHTNNFMNLTRRYVGDQLDEEFSVSKADKIDLLNRSMNFFKSHDQFDQNEFEVKVLADPSVIESFRNYERTLRSESDIVNSFEISAQAVKRQVRVFKSVLKLDKNFHIYIHGNRELVEKGFDQTKNKHFYKIYFDQET
ncbi:MAG: nucleoid-associated protein [Cyclobacteriaceae bacterium]|nr:nucleoid-associated protein [Cyclobacteriaceae bacterium]MDH4294721.1 nucleoid-associated protein [Cyclobacteriaceae bacterium]MDH5247562.1 nucleoid-associated protein [Cyclobacteriaceae bacterium]